MAENILYQSNETFNGPSSKTLLGALSDTVEEQATQWLSERYHPISADLVWALEDFKGRSQILAGCIDPTHDHGLSTTLELATQMGMDAISSADSITELADTISRSADHIQGYMAVNGLIDPQTKEKLDKLRVDLMSRYGDEVVTAS